jgi:hypothetical protein
MRAELRQGDLFDATPYVRRRWLPIENRIELARAFVAKLLRDRPCVECCGEERLVFVHRLKDRRNVPVCRLVTEGAGLSRVAAEVDRCLVMCRRCLLRRARPAHQMLRPSTRPPVVIVGASRTTTSSGENACGQSRSKGQGIVNKKGRVA